MNDIRCLSTLFGTLLPLCQGSGLSVSVLRCDELYYELVEGFPPPLVFFINNFFYRL